MKKWVLALALCLALCITFCCAAAEGTTGTEMVLPDWEEVLMPRITVQGEAVTLQTDIGENIAAIKMTIKDTDGWAVIRTEQMNVSDAAEGKLSFSIPTGSADGFTAGHQYLVELMALPTADSEPDTWEGYWSRILTIVPAEQSGPQVFINRPETDGVYNVKSGFNALYVTGYDPAAENVWIVLDGEAIQGYEGNSLTVTCGYDEPGTDHEVYAVSMYADGSRATSATVSFNVVSAENPALYGENVIPVTLSSGDSLETLPQVVTEGSDIIYTIQPVLAELGLDEQGLDEQVWYDSWIDDLTDREAGFDLPCFTKRVEPEVPHGPLLNADTGAQTVTIRKEDLQAGHTYELTVEIRSSGRTPVSLTKTFTVLPEEMDSEHIIALDFSNDGSTGNYLTLPIYTTFRLYINAPDATVVRFWNGDSYTYLNEWAGGEWPGTFEFDYSAWSPGEHQYYIQAYYGELDETPWDQMEWDPACFSNILTVNMTSDDSIEKVVPEYDVFPTNRTVTQGEYLEVTLTNTDEVNAEGVYTGAKLFNGRDIDSYYGRNGNIFMIPTADLEPGFYTLSIYSETLGAGGTSNPCYFKVEAPENLPEDYCLITTTAAVDTNGMHNVDCYENFSVTFYAPEKEGYWRYYRFFDGQSWWWNEWMDRSVTLDHELDPGTWDVYAEAVYVPEDEEQDEIRIQSEHLHYTAVSQGSSHIQLDAAGSYTKGGNGYTVSIVNENEKPFHPELYADDWWEVCVEEAHGPRVAQFRQDWDELEGSFTFEDDLFEAGKTYRAWLHMNIRGYDQVHDEVCFTVVDPESVDTQKLTLAVNEFNTGSYVSIFPAHTEFNVKVTKDDSITAVRVLNGDNWEVWCGDDSYERDWSFGAGVYGLTAQGTTQEPFWEEEDFDWRDFDWNEDVDWSVTSNTVTVRMNTPNGTLGRPTLELDKTAYTRGEKITATVGKVDGSEWYDIHVQRTDEYGNTYGDWMYDGHADSTGDGTLTFTIPTAHMEAGNYAIWVDNNGTGYQGNGSPWLNFEITEEGQEEPEAVLEIPAAIQTNENIEIYAYVPDADDIWLDIRKEGDPGWRNDRNNGGCYGVWNFGEAFRGTYIFTLYGHVDGEEVMAAGPVELEVKADLGDLDDVTFRRIPAMFILSNNVSGFAVNGEFDPDGRAEWYQVKLVYRGPSGDGGEQTIREYFRDGENLQNTAIQFDISDFRRTGVYEVQVIGGATGYNGTHNRQKILVVDYYSEYIGLTVNGSNGEEPLSVVASEDMTIRITAPEATAIRFFDGERWEWWDSRCLDRDGVYEFGRSMNSGEYTFAAQAAYDEGFDWETFDDWENFDAQSELHWTAMSDVIHVSVSAAGDTDAAVIETIGTVTRGELLPVVITSAGEADSPGMATSLYAEIRNEDGWNMGEGTGVNGLTFEDYPVTLLLPTGNLGEGRYYASVHSSTIGYNSTEAYAAFDIAEPEEDSFIFEVQDGLILDQEFSMSAYAKDASWIDVNIRNTGDGDEFSWGPFDGDHVYNTRGRLGEGTYTFQAVAHYTDENGEETGTWTSEVLTREVQILGRLDDPVINTMGVYPAGDRFNFTVDGLDQGDSWWVEVYDTDREEEDENGNRGWAQVARWDNDHPGIAGGVFQAVIGDNAGHRFEIRAGVNQPGYYGGNDNRTVYVQGDDFERSLTLTVNGSEETEQNILSSQNFRVKVSYAPYGRPTAVRILNGSNWDYWWGEGENFTRNWGFGDGHEVLYAEATWDDLDFDEINENGWANFDWDNDVNWTAGSNTIRLTITSPNGEMIPPSFTILNPEMGPDGSGVIPWGDDLIIEIEDEGPTAAGTDGEDPAVVEDGWFFCNIYEDRGDENGTWWDRVNYNYGYNLHSGINIIPTYNLDDSCRFRIEIGADGEGYAGRSDWKEFRIGERPDESEQAIKHFTVNGGTDDFTAETNEDLQLAAYQSGAEWYDVEITKAGDPDWYDNRNDCRSGILIDQWRTNNKGTYTLTAYAYGWLQDEEGNPITDENGNNQWREEIGSVTVEVEATHGGLSELHAGMTDKAYTGTGIEITFEAVTPAEEGEALDAKSVEYSYWLHSEYDGRWITGDSRYGAGKLTIDTDELQPGVYWVEMDAMAVGYNQSHLTLHFALLDRGDTEYSITGFTEPGYFTVSALPIRTEENARIVAYLPGAEEISLYMRKDNDEYPEEFDRRDGPGLTHNFCRGDAGSYEIYVSGRFGGEWSAPVPVLTGDHKLVVTAENAFSADPVVKVNGTVPDDTAPADEDNPEKVILSIVRDDEAEGYHIQFRNYGDRWNIYEEFIDLSRPGDYPGVTIGEDTVDITIEDGNIGPERVYELNCWAHATGYECRGTYCRFLLEGEQSTGGVTITAEPTAEDGFWVAEDARITITAPEGTTAIHVKKNNEDRWYRYGADGITDDWTIWDPDTVFYAYATTEEIPENDDFYWNELDVNWSMRSDLVTIWANTYGDTAVPTLRFNNQVEKGDWFTFYIDNDGDARQMDIRIRDDDGNEMEFRRLWTPGEYRIPTTNLNAGQRYWVNLSCIQDRHSWTEGPRMELYINEPAENTAFLRIDKLALNPHEPFIPSVYVPGAEQVRIKRADDLSEDGYWGEWDGEYGTNDADWEWWFDEPGEYELIALARFANSDEWEVIARLPITVYPTEKLARAEIRVNDVADATQDLTIEVPVVEGGFNYTLQLHEANRWQPVFRDEQTARDADENGILTFTVPADTLTPNESYWIDCYADPADRDYRYTGSDSSKSILTTDGGTQDGGIVLSMEGTWETVNGRYQIPIGREINVTVTATGSRIPVAIAVYMGDHAEYRFFNDADGSSTTETVSLCEGQTWPETIYARACYDSGESLNGYDEWWDVDWEVWNGLTWEAPSNTLAVDILRNQETEIEGESAVMGGMQYFHFDVRLGENAEEAHANLNRITDGTGEDFVWKDWIDWHPHDGGPDDYGFDGYLTIPTEGLACGDYLLVVDSTGTGYEGRTTMLVHIVEYIYDCTPRIELPYDLTEIGEEAFAGIPARVVIISGNVTTIRRNAFAGSNVELVLIPRSVTIIEEGAFDGCNLKVVYGYGENAEELAEEYGAIYYDLWQISGNG